MRLPKEQCAESKKGHLRCYCSPVCVTNGGRILRSAIAICETFKISCLVGRHHMKGDSGYHFHTPVIPFGAMLEYHLISAEDQSRPHQFGAKVLPGTFLGYVLYAWSIWKGDMMVPDIVKKWRRWTHMNSTPEGSSSQMEQSKSMGTTASENIHLNPGSFGTRRRTRNSSKIRWIVFPTPLQDAQHEMMRKLNVTSGPLQENSFNVITWNPESNCACRQKNHFPFRRSTLTLPERHTHPWMYCWRRILKITGTCMEKGNCQRHGQDSQDSFY